VTAFISNERRSRLIEGVHAAGCEVMAIYQNDFSVETKADQSPLTEADMAAHHALVALLQKITPDVPVLSEESGTIDFSTRQAWQRYWLIDPLDGTKEFVNKNGEFTLNVALIENGVPVFGIVYAPVLQTTWVGQVGGDVFKIAQGIYINIQVRELPDPETAPWKVVGSRSHGAEEFESFCAGLPQHERVSMGSSIKLCLVAEGHADLYPRLAPTCEWDTAAAQAVVTAAGGEVLNAHTLEPLRCNQQESLLNPHFIVSGQRNSCWEDALSAALNT
tara:strand:- start:6461 stop:7288 length:828 start_codon:yes stop_codon:yes gene_type:complete